MYSESYKYTTHISYTTGPLVQFVLKSMSNIMAGYVYICLTFHREIITCSNLIVLFDRVAKIYMFSLAVSMLFADKATAQLQLCGDCAGITHMISVTVVVTYFILPLIMIVYIQKHLYMINTLSNQDRYPILWPLKDEYIINICSMPVHCY